MPWICAPTLLLFVIPPMILGLWAQARVRSAYARASKFHSRRGLTGVDTARTLLDLEGVKGVRIESTPGFLADHYHPMQRRLRLSEAVYSEDSLAAVGGAGHEAGPAVPPPRPPAPV